MKLLDLNVRRSVVALLMALVVFAPTVVAQDGGDSTANPPATEDSESEATEKKQPPKSALAPPQKPLRDLLEVPDSEILPTPQAVPAARIRAAIEEVRKELEAQRARIRSESESMNSRLTEAQERVTSLLEIKAEKLQRLKDLNKESTTLAERVYEAELEADEADLRQKALDAEITRLAVDFRDRHAGSLQALADPGFLEHIDDLASEDNAESRTTRVAQLIERFLDAIEASETVETFETPVAVGGPQGRVLPTEVLRLGYLAGYYHNGTTGESGIIQPRDSESHLTGQGDLPPSRQDAIRSLVSNPGAGGQVPFDVSGGAGLATLGLKDDLKTWFEKGGSFMWPLLFVAVLAFIVVLERSLILTIRGNGMDRRIGRVLEAAERGDLVEAQARAERSTGSVKRVFAAALDARSRGRAAVEDATQEQLLNETPKFEVRLAFIALCAAIAPLMGLLGTVTGMIATFQAVTIFGTSDPRNMAGGISVALITTQGGLYLAIPCLIARGILGSVAGGAINRLEAGAMSLVVSILKFAPEEADEVVTDGEDDSTGIDLGGRVGAIHDAPASRLSDMFDDEEEVTVSASSEPSDILDLGDDEEGETEERV